jgi:5-methylthioadenosine/S-adenosylhomocysteine deaminase
MEGPIRNIVPNLVYAGNGREVRLVMVAGQVLLREGVVQTADEATIRATAQEQAQALSQRVAADPVHQVMALLEPMARGYL